MITAIIIAGFIAELVMLAVIIHQLWFALTHFRLRDQLTPSSMIRDLPSVSVCIPARNEMRVMTECLESVLASTYPKLEILVLDDSSSDTTSTLVKAFAHDGVRFIEGSSLPEGWLGKNHALQGLLDEASGTYVLFMDVDTRLQPDSIGQLVAYLQQKQLVMASVLPQREPRWRAATVFAPLRSFLDILFHRRVAPATASAAWVVNRRVLIDEQQGFAHQKAVIQPESRLAALFMKTGRYHFLMSTKQLGVTTIKSWHAQAHTSIRLLYPLLGQKVWYSAAALGDIVVLLLPIVGIVVGYGAVRALSALIIDAYVALYGIYLAHVGQRYWWLAMLLWPVILIQEACLMIISAERYVRHAVTWKGRPITVRATKSKTQ